MVLSLVITADSADGENTCLPLVENPSIIFLLGSLVFLIHGQVHEIDTATVILFPSQPEVDDAMKWAKEGNQSPLGILAWKICLWQDCLCLYVSLFPTYAPVDKKNVKHWCSTVANAHACG
jgi:hypothetical protein